jgi:hypothetical protein
LLGLVFVVRLAFIFLHVLASKESSSLGLKFHDFLLVLSSSLHNLRVHLSHSCISFLLRFIAEILEMLIFLGVIAARVSH